MRMVFMSSKVLAVWATLALLALLTACGTTAAPPRGKGAEPRVVVAFYPFQFIAERVAGRGATVQDLTAPGAEPHDLELTPRQVAAVSTASLVIYEHSFQPAVDGAVDQSGNPSVLDTTTVVPLVRVDSAAGARREDGPLDPHVWLDPANMVRITKAVETRLEQVDPAHTADYRSGAGRLVAQLQALDRSYATGLRSCARRYFVTSHAAFGYLARHYGLTQIGIAGLSPDVEPSPARILAVQQKARDYGITTIFYETLASPAVAESIAGDLGLRIDVLDPLEGITSVSRGSDYLAVMRSNLAALQRANGCTS